ncbi:arylalcohol dehydrogenase [Pyrrhoderma noxium]|uniref:Arylalcohol dehydrogenase n=1 Tax=Pyrrhoderma noxium TaxID=2282107 RepID=A0A286U8B2_9AGAM|nr:arylalcohol dehydrogenase [Pyrrhoderma noxium]
MSIGDKWESLGMGSMDKESSFKLLDAFFDAGVRTKHRSCSLGGREERGDQLVIATKYTTLYKLADSSIPLKVNYTGDNAKSLKLSLEASLKKLRTTYVDILYVHWWDFNTSIEEIMNHLHHLVVSGKVLYLGVSDTPAWIVATANQYARDNGKTPFVIYQGAWNVMEQSFERDIIPMARQHGLALAPWNVLAAGKLRTNEEEERRKESGEKGRTLLSKDWMRNSNEKKMSSALESVAKQVGAKDKDGNPGYNITAVAIAYLMQKTTYVFPIIGGRKVEHLMANIEALNIRLSDEQIKFIESVVPFDAEFRLL